MDGSDPAQRAIDLIKQYAPTLAAEAAEYARHDPEARLIGMIVERDAVESRVLRRVLQVPDGQPMSGFIGVLLRETALVIIGATAPRALDWIEDEPSGPTRKLPIFFAARSGCRTGATEYQVSS